MSEDGKDIRAFKVLSDDASAKSDLAADSKGVFSMVVFHSAAAGPDTTALNVSADAGDLSRTPKQKGLGAEPGRGPGRAPFGHPHARQQRPAFGRKGHPAPRPLGAADHSKGWSRPRGRRQGVVHGFQPEPRPVKLDPSPLDVTVHPLLYRADGSPGELRHFLTRRPVNLHTDGTEIYMPPQWSIP